MQKDKITVVETAMKQIDAEANQNGTGCAYWHGFLQGALMQQHEDMHGIQEQLAARFLENAKYEDNRVRYVREPSAKTPTYAHQDDAGMDLYASKGNYIPAGGRCTFHTGIHIESPKGYFGAIRAKSGLLRNHGIICSGTIDVGYTGEIMVTLVNTSDEIYCVSEGDKIAQLIIIPYERVELVEVESLEKTERGDNGFGSSGK